MVAASGKLPKKAPGDLLYCPTCCKETSCVTLAMAPWMFDQATGGRHLKVHECQICKCEFPDGCNFDKMDSDAALEYSLVTVIIAMLSVNRSFASSEFDANDALMVQDLLCRFTTTTWVHFDDAAEKTAASHFHTEQGILNHAKFLDHTSWDLKKCLYPALGRNLLSIDQKYTVLEAIKATANPSLADRFVSQAAKIFRIPPRRPLMVTSESTVETLAAVQDVMEECDALVHQGFQEMRLSSVSRSEATVQAIAAVQDVMDEFDILVEKGFQQLQLASVLEDLARRPKYTAC